MGGGPFLLSSFGKNIVAGAGFDKGSFLGAMGARWMDGDSQAGRRWLGGCRNLLIAGEMGDIGAPGEGVSVYEGAYEKAYICRDGGQECF